MPPKDKCRALGLGFCVIGFTSVYFASGTADAQQSDAERQAVSVRVQQRSRYEALEDQLRPGSALSSSDVALALQTSVFVDAGRGRVRFSGESWTHVTSSTTRARS